MSRYTNESPMDFQFENGTGPMDARSPFAQVSANTQRFPLGTNSPSKKRPYSAFESPMKSRNMGSRPSSPEKKLPPLPAYNTIFTTPRKPKPDIDDSSAGETPNSPVPRDDSDATPEHTNRGRDLMLFDDDSDSQAMAGARNARRSPTKARPDYERRSSLLQLATKVKNKIYSPGRGELSRKDHSGAIEKSVARRRKREVDQRVARKRRHSMSDSGDDYPPPSPRKTSAPPFETIEGKPYWMSSFFSFVAQHPTLPNTLSQYAQFIFNVFWLSFLAYIVYCFFSAVLGDVNEKSNEAMADIMAKIAVCTRDYEQNNCNGTVLPALRPICAEYEKCMNQDFRKVGRAKVSARTFAQIFNSFVEPISYKAMIFSCVLIFGFLSISNLAFGFFRHKMQEQQPQYMYGPPPPTPQRSFSGQDGGFYAGTPWHQQNIGGPFEPQPSGGYGQIEGRSSPQKRLVYN